MVHLPSMNSQTLLNRAQRFVNHLVYTLQKKVRCLLLLLFFVGCSRRRSQPRISIYAQDNTLSGDYRFEGVGWCIATVSSKTILRAAAAHGGLVVCVVELASLRQFLARQKLC